jgi:hypothetical protein
MSAASRVFRPSFRGLVADTSFLEEYGRFQQHIVLCEDKQRVSAYLRAISQTPPGEVVVDVGAGTGLLGIVALKCGFQHAFLVEPSRKMGVYAQHIAHLNGVADRVTILNSTLEALPDTALPRQIDLVVTETLSSLIFGFGCWDSLPRLAHRLRNPGRIIPIRGRLAACLAQRDYATRGGDNGGLGLLKRAGVELDLFTRTFRSGGNIYDKKPVSAALEDGTLSPDVIAQFDFSKENQVVMDGAALPVPQRGTYTGLVLYWEVDLCDGNEPVVLTSMDPMLTSWYPHYVPFLAPIEIDCGEKVHVRMLLHPIDAPYTYAFQFVNERRELTHVLYW